MLALARLPRPLRLAAYLACLAVLAWLSLSPLNELQQANLSDKFEHTIAYAVLTAAGLALFPRHPRLAAGFAFGFGLLVEVLQATMGFGRQGDWRDAVANGLGVLIVVGAVMLWRGLAQGRRMAARRS